MNKILITLLSIFIIHATGNAQPTLTSTTTSPTAGEIFYGHSCDTTGISHGLSGAGIVWNFDSLHTTIFDTTTIMTCASTPYCDSFPGATLAAKSGAVGLYSYIVETTSGLSGNGFCNSTGAPSCYYFSNPLLQIYYPCTYTSSIIDTFVGYDATNNIYMSGTNQITADAYGTLQIPSGTFTNTIRVHGIMTTKDSLYIVGFGSIVQSSQSQSYLWFVPGFHNPLLHINYDTAGTGVLHVTNVTYYTQSPVNINQNEFSSTLIDIFPNPANDIISFNGLNENTAYQINNSIGVRIQMGIIKKENPVIEINHLSKGLYFIELTNENREPIVRKLMKE